MKWSLLILTQPSRTEFLERLTARLQPQLEAHEDIELLVWQCNRNISIGENRQFLVDAAQGEYVNFIDDDDLVAADYVQSIHPLLDGVDYIGFQMQLYLDGKAQKPTFHSLEHSSWWEDANGYYRGISHLNPMRKELAQLVQFSGGYGEDGRWSRALTALGEVKTQHYIDRVMYHYYFRSKKEDW